MPQAIEVQNLHKEFELEDGVEIAVDDISFRVEDGEFVTLVGPSGCGKTTTLRCIAGLETPTSGSIKFNDQDMTETPPHKRNLSMMFQNIALYPHMKVWKNIAYPLKVEGASSDKQYEEAVDAAKIVRIEEELLNKYPGDLSGGQRQRAALARTIVQDPYAFLMDEPLSDLDAKLKTEMRKEIQRIHERLGQPTVYVTHDQQEAMTMSDRIAVVNNGNIEQIGTRKELYQYPSNIFVAQFIGNPTMNFFEGTLKSLDDDSAQVGIGGVEFTLEIDQKFEDPDGSEIVIGIRPHDLILSNEGDNSGFEGVIRLIEPIDDRAEATVELENYGEVTVSVPSETDLEPGDNVQLKIKDSGFYLFDENSEAIIARSRFEEDLKIAEV
jgi:multiple sugar transport system ATP-binding protein